jgi:soluble lytic murein transglycosylase
MKQPKQFFSLAQLCLLIVASLLCSTHFAHASKPQSALDALPDHISSADTTHHREYALYRQTMSAINKGHKSRTREGMLALKDHALYPYLLAAELGKRLRQFPYHDIDTFLASYGNTVSAKQLQKKWLMLLAQEKRWQEYLRYYHADIANNELQCHYLEGLHQTGFSQMALEQTSTLWLNAQSLPHSCDRVFKRWQQAGYETDSMVWQRLKLAVNDNNPILANYLSNHASAKLKPYARRLISVHRQPQRLTNAQDFVDQNDYTTDILSHGLQRLASINAELATSLWVKYRGYMHFSDQQTLSIRDKIARQIIASGSDQALDWLVLHDPNAEDPYLLEWRIRLALKQKNWSQAGHWISILPKDLQQQPRWQYWLARVYQHTDNPKANSLLESLAAQRHYYGFLAADILNKNYDFNHSSLASNTPLQQLQTVAAIQRAQAFYEMGELTPARREWFAAIENFDQQQLIAASSLAHQWGWHQQAIHTTIKAEHWNDLTVRFPLAYQTNMSGSAKSATIRLEWLYAIARQESAFALDARSPADARGLLQLLPQTAQGIAKNLGMTFNSNDLYRADKNITFGSNYLKHLLEQFEGNHILATAAYNAGPHRIKKWLEHQPQALPYDIWIETLPFHETRNYVQNVLAFSVIYAHRLGFNAPLISQQESLIGHVSKTNKS